MEYLYHVELEDLQVPYGMGLEGVKYLYGMEIEELVVVDGIGVEDLRLST